MNKYSAAMKNHELFKEFSEEVLQELCIVFPEKKIEKGKFIIVESQQVSQEMYLVLEGSFEVIKKVVGSDEQKRLAVISKGSTVGEMSLMDTLPRSASIRALEPSTILIVTHEKMEDLQKTKPHIYGIMVKNLAKILGRRVRYLNDNVIDDYKKKLQYEKMRSAMGIFFCYTLLLVCSYVFLLRIIIDLSKKTASTTAISSPMLLAGCIGLFFMMKKSSYPLKMYGLTLENAKQHIKQAILWTIPFILLITFLKWLGMQYIEAWQGQPLLHISDLLQGKHNFGNHGAAIIPILMIVYTLFVPVQEFMARGAIQSSLHIFLKAGRGPYSARRRSRPAGRG